jgi:hypothetical protein
LVIEPIQPKEEIKAIETIEPKKLEPIDPKI